MKIKLLVFIFCISNFSFSQWSTSTYAESALYVCPGFTQGIITFDDGSSIILGALSDSRYVQKLDPYGYKLWSQPVEVYNTPGTNNSGNSMSMISDGDGGVVLWWADYRGAEYIVTEFSTIPCNNALYVQHVNKNGQMKWQAGGLQIAPIEGGVKGVGVVRDGSDGFILYMRESDFLRTGASKKEKTWLVII